MKKKTLRKYPLTKLSTETEKNVCYVHLVYLEVIEN